MNDPNAPGGQPAPQTPPPPPPPPAGSPGWQSTPQPPGPPPMGGQPGSGMPSWTNNITARGTKTGPAGVALADIPDRIIAFVIDAIIVGIVGFIVGFIMTQILGDNSVTIFGVVVPTASRQPSLISSLATVVLMLAASAAYFIYMWTRMGGATVGMRVMKLAVRDSTNGGPISQQQAINRWFLVGAPFALYFLYAWGFIGWIVGLAVLVYEIYLIVTTAQSATRQGLHDTYAKTVVAKVA